MDQTLTLLLELFDEKNIVFFSNDEIIFDVTAENDLSQLLHLKAMVVDQLNAKSKIPFRVELFSLHKINGTDGYYKTIYRENDDYDIDFKCLNNYMITFVFRHFLGEEVTENDKVFYHEGLLAKFIDVPNIETNDKMNSYKAE